MYQYSMQNTTYYFRKFKIGHIVPKPSQKKRVESNSGRRLMSFNVFTRSFSKR